MIGRAEWFSRRKYGGWGLTPKTWQGWGYIAAIIAGTYLIQALVPESIRAVALYGTVGLLCLDVIHIMLTMPRDEMELKIEAVAERNAAWGMIFVLGIGVAFQATTSQIDPFVIAALGVGLFLKAVTNFWLEKKGI